MTLVRQIKKHRLLYDVPRSTSNSFLVITGKNGEGKSRLLNQMLEQSFKEPSLFNTAIATSASTFELFPTINDTFVKGGRVDYHYIGTKKVKKSKINSSRHRDPLNLITSSSIGLLSGAHDAEHGLNENHQRLREVFKLLNFLPQIEFVVKKTLIEVGQMVLIENEQVEHAIALLRENAWSFSHKDVQLTLEAINSEVDKNNNFKIGYAVGKRIGFFKGANIYEKMLDIILAMIESGILKVLDVRFTKGNTVRNQLIWHSMRNASSGEQCIYMALIGIASRIRENSIVFIDEPEISLHPEWQEKFIQLLKSVFKNYYDCLFVIATHSPQIISQLNDEDSYIYDINSEELIAAVAYSSRSADYQLATLFNTPGNNNEYLTRVLVTWLVKFSKGTITTETENKEVKMIVRLKDKLSPDDSVRTLIDITEDALRAMQ
ncbi:ATP-binding protein [Serratia fonticola]|uniref:ATP-binding protein n=1 Tax=Serratia fonticola TaxID=47917 RepID=UPI002179FCDA|nr:ATP-binding protein [Serratia fonticola]CAI1776672.1 Predicted ATP-binding protein involved in virulence [Serratia fonticola]